MKNAKLLYIYTDKNILYIKNINGNTEKLANNIYSYSANIDSYNNMHICALDMRGRLIHFFEHNGSWKKKLVVKAFNTIKNIKDMRMYILDNFLNIFIAEKYPLCDNLYKISHLNFNSANYKIMKYAINNVLKDNEYFYRLHIDNSSNITIEYKSSISSCREFNKISFNNTSRKWSNCHLDSSTSSKNSFSSTIRDDLFEYCYSIVYKM